MIPNLMKFYNSKIEIIKSHIAKLTIMKKWKNLIDSPHVFE